MNLLRKHWFDLGFLLAVLVSLFVGVRYDRFSELQALLWISLITLWLHQFEEYRYPGYFPGMMNKVMFKSEQPDRYPLNSNTSLVVNVYLGWSLYLLAALMAERAIWLSMASILVSLGNFLAHSFIFNIRGRTRYNPGMATANLLFLPLTVGFFYLIHHQHLVSPLDYVIGVPFGIVLNYVGILKTIDWMKDERTSFIFPKRSLPPDNRL
ncbi:HXXEE domain-containing protein [Cohnella zeiphila]|uniref:HXXEE domain-containing protein n=1 Tax=Cohnella zeiphila TaxID=2761120 RepID=A0A7X0SQE0_9BACL|nr:HXXEE domain-containing protein [Cohnella zeiphila]MBB6734149.1 HXXEE domain-containing protein [Cohnella zeiphila]